MAKLLKLRRGTTSQHSSFTGAEGEVTVDTDKETLVVHNGSTAGGFPLARADGTGVSNFTITGELDAATLDISGNADIDGTLEADAYTVNGTALNEYIADTVGAMVGSNTETGIAVTYEDGDNTLDFSITSIPGVTFTGDVTFDNSTNSGKDLIWDESDNALEFADDVKASFGTAPDLTIYHDGAHSYIDEIGTGGLSIRTGDLYLRNPTNADYIHCTSGGAVKTYHNGVKTLETHAQGIRVDGPEGGDAEIHLYADEGDDNADKWRIQSKASADYFYIQNYSSGSWESNIFCEGDGGVKLYYDDAQKFETVTGGVTVTGTCTATAFAGDGSALTGIVSFVSGMILIWSGAANAIPSGWVLCNGQNSTPDLRNKFVIGAGDTYAVAATGGAATLTIAETNLPSHAHTVSLTSSSSTANHTHGVGNYSADSGGSHSHTLSGNTSNTGSHSHSQTGTNGSSNQNQFDAIGNSRRGSNYTASTSTANAGDHSHSLSGNAASGGSHTHNMTGDSASGGAAHTHTMNGNTGNAGSGNAVNILPPYYALCYIMKS